MDYEQLWGSLKALVTVAEGVTAVAAESAGNEGDASKTALYAGFTVGMASVRRVMEDAEATGTMNGLDLPGA